MEVMQMANRNKKKVLNIANYQRNATQNHNEISPHTFQNGYHEKKAQITNVGKNMKKRELSYTVGWNVNLCSHCGKQYGSSSKS